MAGTVFIAAPVFTATRNESSERPSTSADHTLNLGWVSGYDESFEEGPPVQAEADRLTLDLDGWEGPLDLLLTLARMQKVDLAKISILALVEQYLVFIHDAKRLKLEIAADYLVMAAWLAYLKSCLLLPKDSEQDPSPDELALRLQLRLQRLGAMREAGARLLARDRLGRDVFLRGAPDGLRVVRRSVWQAELYDLISAYGILRARTEPSVHVIARRPVMTLDEALVRIERLIGTTLEWATLESFLPETPDPEYRRSALASSFVAALELARQGRVEISQQGDAFSPLMVKAA
jgi:segregation and condensation protein A